MRRSVSLLEAITCADFVIEGRKDEYPAMFAPVIAAAKASDADARAKYLNVDISGFKNQEMIWRVKEKAETHEEDKAREFAASMIKFATATLKRHDRIIWFIRWARANYVALSPNQYLRALRKKYPYADHDFEVPKSVMRGLEHYLSLPVPAIQQYVFDKGAAQDILNKFNTLEREWKKKRKHTLTPRPEDEMLLDCGDGWAWFHLPRASCPDEGDAMGHCGNSPREDTEDTILSLREKVMVDGHERWKPHATFIITEDGHLTEMKGRFNEKPGHHESDEKKALIHKHILQLLRNKVVRKIVGGGYEEQNNFSLDDLDSEAKAGLMKERPDLGFAADYGEHLGIDDAFEKKLEEEIVEVVRVPAWVRGDEVVVGEFKTITAAIEASGVPSRDNDFATILSFAIRDFDRLPVLDGEIEQYVEGYSEFVSFISEHSGSVKEFVEEHADDFSRAIKAISRKIEVQSEEYLWKWLQINPHDLPIRWKKEDDQFCATIQSMFLAHAIQALARADSAQSEVSEEAARLMTVRKENDWFTAGSDMFVEYDTFTAKRIGVKAPSTVLSDIEAALKKIFARVIRRIALGDQSKQGKFDF